MAVAAWHYPAQHCRRQQRRRPGQFGGAGGVVAIATAGAGASRWPHQRRCSVLDLERSNVPYVPDVPGAYRSAIRMRMKSTLPTCHLQLIASIGPEGAFMPIDALGTLPYALNDLDFLGRSRRSASLGRSGRYCAPLALRRSRRPVALPPSTFA